MTRKFLLVTAALFSLAAHAGEGTDIKADVLATMKAFNDAYEANDVDGYFSHYADDPVVYFFGERQDIDAYYKLWTETMAAGGGVEKNELSDIVVQVLPGGETAITTYFIDYRMREVDGSKTELKAFESDVWQKIDGEWKVVNLHYSVVTDE